MNAESMRGRDRCLDSECVPYHAHGTQDAETFRTAVYREKSVCPTRRSICMRSSEGAWLNKCSLLLKLRGDRTSVIDDTGEYVGVRETYKWERGFRRNGMRRYVENMRGSLSLGRRRFKIVGSAVK